MIRAAAELLADPTRPEVGELAFTVEGDCQRKGMGSALMKEVIDAGVQAGFERLELEILPDNEFMLALARRFFERIEARNGRLFASIDLAEVTRRSASARSPCRDPPSGPRCLRGRLKSAAPALRGSKRSPCDRCGSRRG